jgi:hypothetical protein
MVEIAAESPRYTARDGSCLGEADTYCMCDASYQLSMTDQIRCRFRKLEGFALYQSNCRSTHDQQRRLRAITSGAMR